MNGHTLEHENSSDPILPCDLQEQEQKQEQKQKQCVTTERPGLSIASASAPDPIVSQYGSACHEFTVKHPLAWLLVSRKLINF